jgi:inorganic pyrophosphatase
MDIIIETPKGSAVKYKYDENHHLFRLKKILPAGLVFPFDFGFIPGTKGEDGDPIDALVISEFQGFPGCIMDCRIVGCIRVEQGPDKKGMVQNDRFIAIPEQSTVFENVISIEDIPSTVISQVESFFVNYINGEGKQIKLKGNLNAAQAMAILNKEMASAE